MIPLSEMVFDSDAELAMARMARVRPPNLAYYLTTVDLVLDRRDPEDPRQPLTMSALTAWEARCHSIGDDINHDASSPAQKILPKNRSVQDKAP